MASCALWRWRCRSRGRSKWRECRTAGVTTLQFRTAAATHERSSEDDLHRSAARSAFLPRGPGRQIGPTPLCHSHVTRRAQFFAQMTLTGCVRCELSLWHLSTALSSHACQRRISALAALVCSRPCRSSPRVRLRRAPTPCSPSRCAGVALTLAQDEPRKRQSAAQRQRPLEPRPAGGAEPSIAESAPRCG